MIITVDVTTTSKDLYFGDPLQQQTGRSLVPVIDYQVPTDCCSMLLNFVLQQQLVCSVTEAANESCHCRQMLAAILFSESHRLAKDITFHPLTKQNRPICLSLLYIFTLFKCIYDME